MSLFVRRRRVWVFTAATALAGVVAGLAACEAEPERLLPALDAKIDETSVSGISSGAYMAGQFQIAHSRLVTGAAIIAGGPYGCAESVFADVMPGPGAAFLNLSKAINGCMLNALTMWGVPNPRALAEQGASGSPRTGRIDPIDGRARRPHLSLLRHRGSHRRPRRSSRPAAEFYARLGVPAGAAQAA